MSEIDHHVASSGLPRKVSDDLVSIVAGIRKGFLERLNARLLEIDTLLALLDKKGLTSELQDAIAQHAHKTAGVAPSFGFYRLGELARRVESAWSKELQPEKVKDAVQLTEAFLDEIEGVMNTTGQSQSL